MQYSIAFLRVATLILAVFVPVTLYAQGAYVPARSVNSNVNGVLRPVAGAFITVCSAGNANVPCAPALANVLFKDQALTQPLANPTTTDANGNYPTMALAAGNYTITETAVGFTGFSYQITVTCGTGGCAASSLTISGATVLTGTVNGECAVTSGASLSAANAVCSTSSTKIHVWPGAGVVSGAGLTIAAQLQVDAGSQVSGSPTINGPIQAGPYQIFTGTPTIGGASNPMHAAWFPGADIIAQIGNAYTASSSNVPHILIDQQASGACYTATSTANLNTAGKAVIVEGIGPSVASSASNNPTSGPCINYTPVTATAAFTADWTPISGGAHITGAGFRNFSLVNNNCGTGGGCGSSAIGVNVGVTNAGMRRGLFQNMTIQGFGVGVQFQDSAGLGWGVSFLHDSFAWNTTGVKYNVNHENDQFINTTFIVNGTGVINFTGGEISFFGGSIDSNTTCGVSATGSIIRFSQTHFENNANVNVQYVCGDVNTTLGVNGGSATDDTSGGTTAQNWFTFGSGQIMGMTFNGGVGGRTYTGVPFNVLSVARVDVFSSSTTAFPTPQSICNISNTCVLTVTQPVGGTSPFGRFFAESYGLQQINCTSANLTGSFTENLCADVNDGFIDWFPGPNSSMQHLPQNLIITTQYTNSTTTFTNVTGGNTIQFSVVANRNYSATCHLYYQAAATGGLNIEFTGPSTPTAVRYGLLLPVTTGTAPISTEADAFATSLGAVVGTAAVNFDAIVSFSLVNGANAGTVNLLAKSSAAAQLQIQAGSFCQVQ